MVGSSRQDAGDRPAPGMTRMASISFAGILNWLLCAGVAGVVLAVGYLSYPRWKRLTPLAKCVVLSVSAHLLLIGLLSQFRWSTFTGPHNPRVRFVRGGQADFSADGPDELLSADE